MDSRRRRYALAGAIAVRTGEFLRVVHTAVGKPSELDPRRDSPAMDAAIHSYTAAAACSTLTARLLAAEGIDLKAAAEASAAVEGNHTPSDCATGSAWRANVLASAAAIAELQAAKSAWLSVEVPRAGQVVAMIETMLSYTAELTNVLEADRPGPRS